jgi:hypothetical protein
VNHFIECKLSDTTVSYALRETLTTHPDAQPLQLVNNLSHGRVIDAVSIVPASEWLNELASKATYTKVSSVGKPKSTRPANS